MTSSLKEAIEFDKRIDALDEKLKNLKPGKIDKKISDTYEVLCHAQECINKQREEARNTLYAAISERDAQHNAAQEALTEEKESLLTARNALLCQTACELD